MVYNCINKLQQGLYPATCLLCGAPGIQGMDICASCLHDLPHNQDHCLICALPLPSNHAEKPICGRCLQRPPSFDRCHAPFTYGYPVSGLISDFKFNGKLHTGRLLAELLIGFIERNDLKLPDLVMPVPLHPRRLRARGFNQALELARPVARHFNIPLDTKGCRRIKATEAQSGLDKKIRMRNMRSAFEVVNRIDCEHLVLIDDVVTTGATVNELAKALKGPGVKRIDVWALARTP